MTLIQFLILFLVVCLIGLVLSRGAADRVGQGAFFIFAGLATLDVILILLMILKLWP